MARSRDLAGPYELHPDVHILSSRGDLTGPLQRAGHADLVETPDGDTFMVYLCGRPLPNRGRCILGRETAIQPMRWGEDGWLRTLDGSGRPDLTVEVPATNRSHIETVRHDFDDTTLPIEFQWLRTPRPEDIFSLTDRPGHLRLYGREIDRQPLHPGAGRAAAGGVSLYRHVRDGLRPAAFPANGGPCLLL